MNHIQDKKTEFSRELDNFFVESHSSIKSSITDINNALQDLRINFQYTSYDEFCLDYKNENLALFEKKGETPKSSDDILKNIIIKKRIQHGLLDEKNICLNE